MNVVKLLLPPLRERREDISLLIEHFIEKFNRKMGGMIEGVSDKVPECLMHYDFPGNVRELENIIEHTFVMCRGEEIQLKHLPPEFAQIRSFNQQAMLKATPLQEAERERILEALKRHNWNKVKTAKELGLHRATLYRKMEKYGIGALKPSHSCNCRIRIVANLQHSSLVLPTFIQLPLPFIS